jgi:hypothetical protein
MGMYEGRGGLAKAMKDLNGRWVDTKLVWNDAQSRAFQEKFIEPWQQELLGAVSAMDSMAVLMNAIRRECSDEK